VVGNDAKIVIGADVSGAMGGINQILGAMPGLGAAIAGGFSIAAVTAFVRESVNAADAVNTLSEKIGVGATVITGWQHAAQMSNVSNEALSTSLIKLSRNIGENSAAFQQYGIATTDASGKLLSTDQVFAKIADKMQATPDAATRAAMAMALLGKSGADLIPMLNEGSVGLEKFRLEAEMAGTAISDDFAKQSAEFNDNLDRMALMAKGAANSIASLLIPALNSLADVLTVTSQEKLKAYQIELANLKEEGVVRTEWQRQRIAMLEQESGKLEQVIRLEQARAALAGAGKLGDTRDARDRAGEAGSQAGAIAKFEAGKKTPKGKAAKAEKESNWIPGDYDAMGMDSEADQESQIAKAADVEAKKQKAITEESLRGQGERYAALTANEETDRLLKEEQLALDLETLTINRELWLLDEAAYQERKNALIINAAERQSTSLQGIAVRLKNFEELTALNKTKTLIDLGSALTAGFATQSKTAFELNKKMAIGKAVINTYDSAVASYNALAGIYMVGPILGAIAAAGAISFGMAQVGQIRSQQFGGGGGGGSVSIPSMPSYSAARANSDLLEGGPTPTPVSIAASQGKAETARTQVNVTLVGTAFDYKTITTQLIPLLNEASANGAEIRVMQGA